MDMRTLAAALALASFGLTALAHTGATGVMKQRMDAMGEMAKTMKTLVPMMRRKTDYDAEVVRAAAEQLMSHAGSQMTDLFPEGSNAMPSEARDAIWEEWDAFTALAEGLYVAADGMKKAADNGLAPASGAPAIKLPPVKDLTADMLAEWPVNASFRAAARTCSACHKKFRVNKD